MSNGSVVPAFRLRLAGSWICRLSVKTSDAALLPVNDQRNTPVAGLPLLMLRIGGDWLVPKKILPPVGPPDPDPVALVGVSTVPFCAVVVPLT